MIKVWSYLEEYQDEKKEIQGAISSVLESGQLILGPNVASFEEEFSKWVGGKYSVGVANGTDAIFLALKALDIKKGDQVITVSNTAVPTVSAITAAGAEPVFVDIDPETYLMDVDKIESRINKKTKAVIAVHLYGQAVDMDKLKKITKKRNIFIIEDCAQSHGAIYKKRMTGSIGDISAFSFYPTKILGTYGDGGLCMTNSSKIRDKLKRLRFYGMKKTYYSLEQGFNSRLDELHAAILRVKLKKLKNYINKRQKIAAHYTKELKNTSFMTPKTAKNNVHAFYVYVLRHPQRDKVMKILAQNDIFVNITYPYPIHTMSGMKNIIKKYNLPHSDKAADEIFSLPMYPMLKREEQNKVIKILKQIDKNF